MLLHPQTEALATSPCIDVCTLDAGKRFCQGCFRSLDEIAAWSTASNAERLRMLAAAAQRRHEHAP